MQIFISSVAVRKFWRQGLTGHVFKRKYLYSSFVFLKTPEANIDSIFKNTLWWQIIQLKCLPIHALLIIYHKKVSVEHNEKRSKFISSPFRFSDLAHQWRFQPLTIFLYSSKQHDSPLYLLLFLPEGELCGAHCFGHCLYVGFAAVFLCSRRQRNRSRRWNRRRRVLYLNPWECLLRSGTDL